MTKEYTINEILLLLVKRIWIISVCVIFCTSGTYVVSRLLIDKEFTATVTMCVEPNKDNPDIYAPINDLTYAKQVVSTYLVVLETNSFMESVSEESGRKYTVHELKEMITLNSVNDTEIFEIHVTSKDPGDSFNLANTISRLAPEKITEIKRSDSVKVVDPTTLPSKPSSPNILLNTIIGFAVGAILGILIAFAYEILDKRIKNEDDLLKYYDVPVLGSMPFTKEKTILNEKTNFMVLEAYKTIRTKLLLQNKKSKCLLITSPSYNEGKSTNCCNLGITLAQMKYRVLILDCNLRKPFIHQCFNRICGPGLSELLAEMESEGNLAEIIQNTDYQYLNFLCGGTVPPNPAELLGSVKMGILLKTLSQEYDYILLDTPPANLVADTLALSAVTDGVILVVRQEQTTHPELSHTLASLKFANAKVLGMILNCSRSRPYVHKRYRKYNQNKKLGR